MFASIYNLQEASICIKLQLRGEKKVKTEKIQAWQKSKRPWGVKIWEMVLLKQVFTNRKKEI